MDKHIDLHKNAEVELKNANHLISVTLDILQSNKVVSQIMNHISSASSLALESLLVLDRKQRNIKAFPRHFQIMLQIYADQVQNRREMDPKYLNFLKRLSKLVTHIEQSSIQFRKNNEYIFTTDNYHAESININLIRKYYNLAEEFISQVGDIVYVEDG